MNSFKRHGGYNNQLQYARKALLDAEINPEAPVFPLWARGLFCVSVIYMMMALRSTPAYCSSWS